MVSRTKLLCACVLPPDGAQQGGSGLVVEGDDDRGWRKIRVVVKSGAPGVRDHSVNIHTKNDCPLTVIKSSLFFLYRL